MANDLTQYVAVLRKFIKDNEPLNRLLNFEQENIDDYLDLYINMAFGFLNSIPPPIYYSLETFPIPTLLIHQATIECLISNGILQARNDLTYNNGGVTVKISDANRYLSQLQLLFRMADSEIAALKNIKIAQNISGGFGGVHSPYATMHGRAATLQPNSIMGG